MTDIYDLARRLLDFGEYDEGKNNDARADASAALKTQVVEIAELKKIVFEKADDIRKQSARIAELEAALKPLADMYIYFTPDKVLRPSINGEDITYARKLLYGDDAKPLSAEAIVASQPEITLLRERITELESALKPFAEMAVSDSWPKSKELVMTARTALHQTE